MGRTRALIFDFDGLILDTEVPDYESWQEIYQEHGCALPLPLWAQYIGTSSASIPFDVYAYLEEQCGQPIDRATIRTRRRARYAELVAARSILPGIQEHITTAKQLGLKLGVASSSSRGWVVGHLARLGLDMHFDCITCADDVTRAKPDPAPYLAVLAALDVHPDEAIALEDSPNGIAAAKAAGIFCVAVPNPMTCRLPLDQADLRLTSLADLPLEQLLVSVERHKRAMPGLEAANRYQQLQSPSRGSG